MSENNMTKIQKYFYVRRLDTKHNGTVIEIPEDHLTMTLKNHPTWQVIEETTPVDSQATIAEAPKAPAFECPLCGHQAATEKVLKAHKIAKHK